MKEETAAHLLCLLQRAEFSDPVRLQCEGLAVKLDGKSGNSHLQGDAWDFFFELAEQNSAYILTAKNLAALKIDILPHERWKAFQEKAKKFEALALERAAHISRILKRADAADLPAIILKGAMLGPELYHHNAYKKMNDVDLLFSFEDAKRFAEILRSENFMSVGHLFGDEEFSESNHHCPPFVSADLKCVVGIHWGLNSPHSRWKVDHELLWKNKSEINAYGAKCYRMSWEENLLHLCTHLPFFKIGCRELADVYNVARSHQTLIDWDRFEALAEHWEAEDAAYRVLSLANEIDPFTVPTKLLKFWKIKASLFTQKDTEKRLKLGYRLIETRSTHIAKIEKAFALFRISDNYAEKVACWAMTWKLTFWPKQKDLSRLLGEVERDQSFLHGASNRARAFSYSWRAMARDLGNFPLIFITLQNIGIVIRETFLLPFKKQKAPVRSHESFKLMEMLE